MVEFDKSLGRYNLNGPSFSNNENVEKKGSNGYVKKGNLFFGVTVTVKGKEIKLNKGSLIDFLNSKSLENNGETVTKLKKGIFFGDSNKRVKEVYSMFLEQQKPIDQQLSTDLDEINFDFLNQSLEIKDRIVTFLVFVDYNISSMVFSTLTENKTYNNNQNSFNENNTPILQKNKDNIVNLKVFLKKTNELFISFVEGYLKNKFENKGAAEKIIDRFCNEIKNANIYNENTKKVFTEILKHMIFPVPNENNPINNLLIYLKKITENIDNFEFTENSFY